MLTLCQYFFFLHLLCLTSRTVKLLSMHMTDSSSFLGMSIWIFLFKTTVSRINQGLAQPSVQWVSGVWGNIYLEVKRSELVTTICLICCVQLNAHAPFRLPSLFETTLHTVPHHCFHTSPSRTLQTTDFIHVRSQQMHDHNTVYTTEYTIITN